MRVLALALAVVAWTAAAAPPERHSVTFLLGADRDEAGFFAGAAQYYRTRADRGEEVVASRTLADVREYLARDGLRGDAPWGTIRLVAHGSEWYGLLVPVFSDRDGDATLTELESASSSGEFPPLEGNAFDTQTRLVIESCGIARRPDFERAIATLFFGNGETPGVEASRDYVAFRTGLDAAGREVSERAELPYVAIVTRADVADASTRSELRETLEKRWLDETGQPPGADLVMRDIPVEVRQPVSAASTPSARLDPPSAALLAALRDRGLRRDQLRWTRENAMNVGRAQIVTLAPIAEDWVRDAGR